MRTLKNIILLFLITSLFVVPAFAKVQIIELLAAGVTDDSGDVLSSGTILFYEAGTTTLKTVYSNFAQTNPHSNPATLDSAGRLIAYTSARTKLVISSSAGALIRTIDNVGTSDADLTILTATAIAGDGLVADANGQLDVNTDVNSLEVSSDQVRVKADGYLALSGYWVKNLGLTTDTGSVALDSIKITGAKAALSSTNIFSISLENSTTPGLIAAFTATADVSIDLTGAHWGFGTAGDRTDEKLVVYAINDNGTLKFGVALEPFKTQILNTDSSATATDITAWNKMLVNTTLSAGTWPCKQIGWVNGNFDDTGGTSEDLWAVQFGIGDLNVTSEYSNIETITETNAESNWPGAASTYADEGTLTVGPGIWDLSAGCYTRNDGAVTAANSRIGFGTTAGDASPNLGIEVANYNVGTDTYRYILTPPSVRVTATAVTIYRLKTRHDASGSSLKVSSYLEARRVK